MINRKSLLLAVLGSTLILFAYACATVVNPSGGPADRIAPKRVACFPPDSSVDFSDRRIVIEFDEFIKTNNPSSQLVMNPFAGKLPQIEAQGKKLIIKLPDSLKDNTTYTIAFGGAISDITEGNKALELSYIFSTGNRLDSFSISGILTDAYSRETVEDAWIFLHRKKNGVIDSKPEYLVRANDNGEFRFSCISEGAYYVYALKDANSDYLFNLPNEKIAFQSEAIILNEENPIIDSVQLLLFQEPDTIQKVLKSLLYRNMVLKLCFKIPLQNPEILVSENTPDFLYALNSANDTLTMWFYNSVEDTAVVYIHDGIFNDTIVNGLILGQKGRNNESAPIKMEVKSNIHAGSLNHFSPLELVFSDPVIRTDPSKIIISQDKDTLPLEILKKDSIGLKWDINAAYKPNKHYKVQILTNCFEDIYGRKNDSLIYDYTTTDKRDFGDININLSGKFESPMIIELLSSGNATFFSKALDAENQIVNIPLIRPGEYTLRLIIDSNNNGNWDTGNLLLQKQPEKVVILPSKIAIKANWTSEINWIIR